MRRVNDEDRRRIVYIMGFVVIMLVICVWLNTQEWAFNPRSWNREDVGFECVDYNISDVKIVEPGITYACWEGLLCTFQCYDDGECRVRMFAQCIRSEALVDNKTVFCNSTPEECEESYKSGGTL